MTSHKSRLTLIWNARPLAGGTDSGASDRRATAVLLIVILLLGAASAWVAAAMDPAQAPVAMPKNATPSAPQSFEYFPSQYVNQATEREEHIQAF